MAIGKTIAAQRKRKQLTQKELATQLNVSDKTISSWENERTYPDISMIIQLSDVLQLSLDELLREDSQMIQEMATTMKAGQFYQRWKKWILGLGIIILIFSTWNIAWVVWKEHRQSKIEHYQGIQTFVSDELLPSDYYYLIIENPPESEKQTASFHVAIENYMAIPYLRFNTSVKDFKVFLLNGEIQFLSNNEFNYSSLRGVVVRFNANLQAISGEDFGEKMSQEAIDDWLAENQFQLEAMLEAVLPVYEDLF